MEENNQAVVAEGQGVEEHHQQRSSKRQRRCEPDVTVVVGGVEFQHYSQYLCCSSDYFDAALYTGMKESQEKRVVLTGDWNPEEWKVVSKCFEPSPVGANAITITEDNIRMLLPWFHYLEMTGMLKACERFLRASTLKDGNICNRSSNSSGKRVRVGGFCKTCPELHLCQAELVKLCSSFELCAVNNFQPLMKDMKNHLEHVIVESPDFFTLDSVRALVAAMRASNMEAETKESLWALLKVYVPQHVREAATDGIDALLVSPLFPTVLLDGMGYAVLAKREQWLPKHFANVLHGSRGMSDEAQWLATRQKLQAMLQEYPGVLSQFRK